jgi:predicted cation transporter
MIRNIKKLWLSETPKLWKYIRNISASISAIATAILAAETAAGIDLSNKYKDIIALCIAIGAGISAFSQLHKTKKDD